MKNYIIRIYRQKNDNPKKIVGLVEEPEIEGRKAFTNLDELWGILNPVKEAGLVREDGRTAEGITLVCPAFNLVIHLGALDKTEPFERRDRKEVSGGTYKNKE